LNQFNVVHILRSEKKLIIKCQHHPIPFSTTTHKHSPHLVPILPNLTNLKRISQQVRLHKPIILFLNRLKNNKQNPHMDKIIEIFNQVKINVPLLDASTISNGPTVSLLPLPPITPAKNTRQNILVSVLDSDPSRSPDLFQSNNL